MDKNKKHSLFNLFDIVVIALILILAAVLLLVNVGQSRESEDAGTVTYTMLLEGMRNNSGNLISPGDELVDKVKKYNIGTVVSVDVETAERQVNDYENGGLVDSVVEDQQNAIVIVEADCTETSSQITVDGGYIIRAGLTVSVRGPGYWGTGYIISVDRGDAR